MSDTGHAATSAPGPSAAGLVLCALTVAVLGQGAYYGRVQVLVGAFLLAAVVVVLASPVARGASRRLVADHGLRWVAGGAAAVVGTTVVSATRAGDPAGAVATLALLAGAAAVVLVLSTAGEVDRREVGRALVGLAVVVAVLGLAGVLLRLEPLAHVDGGIWRAAGPMTYANASAALLGPAALVCTGLRLDRPTDRLLPAALTLLLAGLAATGSRAGLAACLLGLLVLAVLRGPVAVLRGLVVPAVGAAVVALTLASAAPADQAPRPVLGAVALVAATTGASLAPRIDFRRWRRPVAIGALLVLVLLTGAVASGLTGTAGLSTVARDRATLASPDRTHETTAGLETARTQLLSGVGPGRLHPTWVGPDGVVRTVDYVHDEYLQRLGETGLPGLLAVLALVGAAGHRLVPGRTSRPGGPAWPAGALAGFTAFALHSGADFLWHVPALVLLAAALVALGCRSPAARPSRRPMSVVALPLPSIPTHHPQEISA